MIKKILFLFVFLFLFQGIHALSFTDNFNGYTANFLDVDDTNTSIQWTPTFDVVSIANDTNRPHFGTRNLKAKVIVGTVPDENRASVQRLNLVPHIDISGFRASGKMFNWMYIDGNCAQINSVSMRTGYADSNYDAFYNFSQFGEAYYCGWQLMTYDLNNVGTIVGTQVDTNVGYIETSTNYGGGPPVSDHNFVINRFWIEKSTGTTDGVWQQLQSGIIPYGWSKPILKSASDYAFAIAPTDRIGFNKQAFVFAPGLANANGELYTNITLTVNLKQVDSNMGTKFIYDYVDLNNYSSIYVQNTNGNTATVGRETYVSGARTFDENTVTYVTGVFHPIGITLTGTALTVDFNGIRSLTATAGTRKSGSLGVDSNSGQTNIDDYSIILVSDATTISPSGAALLASPAWNIIPNLLLPILLLLLMAGLVYGGVKTGDPKMVLLGIILIYLIYTMLNALFFN